MTHVALGVVAAGPAADAIGAARADAGRRPVRQQALRPGRHAVGPRGRGRGGRSGCPGSACPGPRGRSSARSRRCATQPARAGRSTTSCSAGWAARRWRPRSSAPRPGSTLTVLDSTDPDRCARRSPTGSSAPSWSSPASPASTVETDTQRRAYEAAFTDAGIDPAGAHRRGHRPRQPAGRGGPRRRLPRRQRRPERRRPLLRADRLRAGPERPGRRRHRGPARRGRGGRRPARRGRRGQPRAAPRRRHGRHRRRCATSSSSSTAARASSASPTGPSSSSPRAPASRAPASCPSSSATPTTPRCAGPRPTSTVARLVGDSDDEPARPQTPDGDPRSEVHVSGAARRPDAALGGRDRRRRPAARASTRSTSPTSRAPRRPPAACSTAPAAARTPAAFTDGAVEVRALGGDWLGDASTVADGARRAVRPARPRPRLRRRDGLPRPARRRRAGRRARRARPGVPSGPTTFGWGPRFLHSTGQFHKGGPADRRLPADHRRARTRTSPSPDATFTFGDFIAAQAAGDAQVLADHGRPVLRLHLTDHDAGLAQLRRRPALPDAGGAA